MSPRGPLHRLKHSPSPSRPPRWAARRGPDYGPPLKSLMSVRPSVPVPPQHKIMRRDVTRRQLIHHHQPTAKCCRFTNDPPRVTIDCRRRAGGTRKCPLAQCWLVLPENLEHFSLSPRAPLLAAPPVLEQNARPLGGGEGKHIVYRQVPSGNHKAGRSFTGCPSHLGCTIRILPGSPPKKGGAVNLKKTA